MRRRWAEAGALLLTVPATTHKQEGRRGHGRAAKRPGTQLGRSEGAMAEALERKLRPLYEAIDGRQFKQALKLSAALLQARARSS